MDKYAIYHVSFPNQYLLMSTLMRFQEHYESPQFRGKVFSHEEYMDWYASKKGRMSYFEDWYGCNFPAEILSPFREGLFDPLSGKERKFLQMLADLQGRFYVVATMRGETEAEDQMHEFMHGLWYLHPKYAQEARTTLGEFKLSLSRAALMTAGYADEVLDDECVAYLITTPAKDLAGPEAKEAVRARTALLRLAQKHLAFNPSSKRGHIFLSQRVHHLEFQP